MKTKEGNFDNDTRSIRTFWKGIYKKNWLGVDKVNSPSIEPQQLYGAFPKENVKNNSERIRDKSKSAFVVVRQKY